MTTELVMTVFREDIWTSVLAPYKFAPVSAFSLSQVLYSLREDIKRGNSELAIAILTDGIEKLFPFSQQYEASHADYWQAVKGDA